MYVMYVRFGVRMHNVKCEKEEEKRRLRLVMLVLGCSDCSELWKGRTKESFAVYQSGSGVKQGKPIACGSEGCVIGDCGDC